MNKLFILSILTALASQSTNAAVVTVMANPVTVTAGSAGQASTTQANVAAAKYHGRGNRKSGSTGSVSSNSGASTVSTSASNTGGPISSSSGSGDLDISQDDFIKAWTNSKQYLPDANINPPNADQYKAFISNAGPKGGITSKTELAMFLAEIMWESGGLIYKSELACKENNCAGSYQDAEGKAGKYYYGRGYIQLTWGANYKAASKDLYNDESLLDDPDQVATNEDRAWAVSFWFWKSRVRPALKGTMNFGLATDAINGALECRGTDPTKAKKRFKIYSEILKVFEPSATPIETGCYN